MNIFSLDSPFVRFFEKLFNLVLLNILFIICSIPIVTIGPSLTAVYWVTLKMVRNEEGGIIQDFFHSFVMNLKQGIFVGIIVLGVGVFLGFEIFWTYQLSELGALFDKFIFLFIIFVSAVYLMTVTYVWPLLAKYNNSTMQLFRTSVALAVRHLFATVLMGAITAFPILMLMFTIASQALALLFLILIGIPAIAYLHSIFMVRIFDQYLPAEPDENEDDASSLSE